MPNTIRDGKGRGYLAEVDANNKLNVACVTEELIGFESHTNGSAFNACSPPLTLTTTGGRMTFFKNTDSSQDFRILDISISWNGGSTNHNRCVEVYFGFNDTTHDTNVTTGTIGTMNKTINSSADATFLYWDETGDGMSGGTEGGLQCVGIIGQGRTIFPANGAMVIGYNGTFVIKLKAEEIGEASICLRGAFVSNS